MKRAIAWVNTKWRRRPDAVAEAYRDFFGAGAARGELILQDLLKFCFISEPPALTDAVLAEGMHMVFRHVIDMAKLTVVDLLPLVERNRNDED